MTNQCAVTIILLIDERKDQFIGIDPKFSLVETGQVEKHSVWQYCLYSVSIMNVNKCVNIRLKTNLTSCCWSVDLMTDWDVCLQHFLSGENSEVFCYCPLSVQHAALIDHSTAWTSDHHTLIFSHNKCSWWASQQAHTHEALVSVFYFITMFQV